MYWVDHLLIMPQTGYTTICVTFMVDGNEDMTIISDFSEFGGLQDVKYQLLVKRYMYGVLIQRHHTCL